MDKAALRKKQQKLRRNLKDKALKSGQILKHLESFLDNIQSIAVYYSMGDEVDTHALIDLCFERGIKVYLPKLNGKKMDFVEYRKDSKLIRHPFGMWEPDDGEVQTEFDCMIVPLLAFNPQGYRVGYGGGYYDRYMADYHGLTIGIAYDINEDSAWEHEPWDIPCAVIVTETRTITHT